MPSQQLKKWWQIILSLDENQLGHPSSPLAGLVEQIEQPGLPVFPTHKFVIVNRFQIDRLADLQKGPPSFKNLNQDILLALRYHLYHRTQLEQVTRWAEKLMRYCEVYLHNLRRRVLEKWSDPATARLCVLQLVTFLMDYYYFSRDLRFLNCGLKMMDLPWLLRARQVEVELKKDGDSLACGLFAVRLVLAREYALRQLEKSQPGHA